MNLPVLIPAYNPNEALLDVANSLIRHGVQHVIIVNDGSKPECDHIFKSLETMKQCRVIHHAVNLGKGRAIKTGLNYFYLTFNDAPGIITADADGQHLPEDILKVAETFRKNPDALVIGARKFDKGTPMRSLIGNIITKYVFRFLIGKKISDTQSGLRCIPRKAVPRFIEMEGEKYEYEMNMLISTKTNAMDVVEEEITTVYIGNNKSSHFNPLIDSMTIYFLLIRFSFSSFFASIIDFIIFAVIYSLSSNILAGIVFARLVAGNINFFVNKNLVFYSKENVTVTIVKYYTLFVVLGGLAFISVRTMSDFGINVILAKIVTETLLFIASFSIQRDFIFTKQKEE
ncbi:MAG: dolichyl-phosphate mannose synthase [Nitrospirae bacterium RBG_13_41_22]|nr:MAG: dolichyl-phosphate mannose synthase [Nitrospirae bacterium RBG_13_41_22]